MNRSTLLLGSSTLLALGLFAWQGREASDARLEASELRLRLERPTKNRASASEESARRSSADRSTPHGRTASLAGGLPGIMAEPDPLVRILSLLAYVETLSAEEIPEALEEIRRNSPEWDAEAKMLAHILLTRWGQEDPDGAYEFLATMGFKKSGNDPSAVLSSLAAIDPERAAAWVDDPENGVTHMPWLDLVLAGTVAKEWVRQDPAAALAWAESLSGGQKTGALSGLLGVLATSNPREAARIAADLEPGDARKHAIGEIAKNWARRDPEQSLAWASSLEGEDRNRATREALTIYAREDGAKAAAYLDDLGGGGEAAPYLTQVANEWAQQEPAEAATWVTGQEDGDGKNGAMGKVLWNWTKADPEAASDWLATQPAGPAKDSGIGGLAYAAFDFDPQGVMDWALQVQDDNGRHHGLTRGLSEWLKRDEAAATDWAAANGIPLPEEAGK